MKGTSSLSAWASSPRGFGALVLALGAWTGNAGAQEPIPPLERIVGIELTEVTLREALNQIQRATGAALVYSPDFIPEQRLVSCPCQTHTLGGALDLLLRGTNLSFDALGNQVRIAPRQANATEPARGAIAGVILSEADGEPVPNALIQLNDGRGTLSNENGRFILVNIPPGLYNLAVTGLGWVPEELEGIEVSPGATAALEVRLTRRVIPLSALVVSPGTFLLLDDVRAVALQTLTREEIETVPQLGEDVFRSLKRLPGVAAGDISTRLFVRGGQDRETLILLDGMELYEPYHLKDFEGALGIVDINAVGGIDLHAGGFPVDFGDRAAGVFDMETRAPPSEGNRTMVGLSITNATFMTQGAFANGRGQWLLSGRRGYMDVAFRFTDVDPGISPRYYDLLGKLKYQLGSRHTLSAHVLQAGDNLKLDTDALGEFTDQGRLRTHWGNAYGWLTWKAYFSPRIRAQTVASAGRVARERIGFVSEPGRVRGPDMVDVSDKAHFDFLGIKQDWTADLSDDLSLRWGFQVNRLLGDYDYRNKTRWMIPGPQEDLVAQFDSVSVGLAPSGTELEAYGALRVRPAPWVTAEVGLRYDRRTHTNDSDLSPRLHALVDLGDRTTLRAGWGLYHQSQGMHELEAGDGETLFAPSERASQVALGLEHQWQDGIKGRLELYSRKVDRPRRMYLNLWREVLPFPELDGDRVRVDPAEGRAKGLEILLARDSGALNWSAAYALSSTESLIDGKWTPQYWDQTHAFTLTLGWKPTPRWNISGAFQVHSGWPFTPQIIQYDTLTVFQEEGLASSLRWREEFGELNTDRLPAYHRLDLRVTRRFPAWGGTMDVYLDLFNAYGQSNLRSYEYVTRFIDGEVKWVRLPDDTLLPFLPSIGFRWEF